MIERVSAVTTVAPAAISGAPVNAETGDGFASALKTAFAGAADAVRLGEASAVGAIEGKVPVREAVEQVLAAERALQAGIAIRDKLVGAYLELSRMQI